MSQLVLLMKVRDELPGGVSVERARSNASPSRMYIDWLVSRGGRTYVDVQKMLAWAKHKGKLVPPGFMKTVGDWGFEDMEAAKN